MEFSELLKELRKEKNISQKDLAAAISKSWRAIQNYELGKQEPTLGVLTALADYFNIPLDYLLGRGFFSKLDVIKQHLDALWENVIRISPSRFKNGNFTELQKIILIGTLIQDAEIGDDSEVISIKWNF